MKLRYSALGLLIAACVIPCARTYADAASDLIVAALEQSRAQKKGVMIYTNGAQIGGGVTDITLTYVVLRSQMYGRIVVRIDRIDAVAGP